MNRMRIITLCLVTLLLLVACDTGETPAETTVLTEPTEPVITKTDEELKETLREPLIKSRSFVDHAKSEQV